MMIMIIRVVKRITFLNKKYDFFIDFIQWLSAINRAWDGVVLHQQLGECLESMI